MKKWKQIRDNNCVVIQHVFQCNRYAPQNKQMIWIESILTHLFYFSFRFGGSLYTTCLVFENIKIKKRGRTNCSLWIAVNCLNPNLCFVIFYQATLVTLLICLITCGGIIWNVSKTIIWRTKCYAKIVIQKLAMACLHNYSFATCIFAWNYEWIITWEQPLNWVRRDDTRHEKWNIFCQLVIFLNLS